MKINNYQVLGEKTEWPYIQRFSLEIPKDHKSLLISDATFSYLKVATAFTVTVISNSECKDMISVDFLATDLSAIELSTPDGYNFLSTVTAPHQNSCLYSSYAVFYKLPET